MMLNYKKCGVMKLHDNKMKHKEDSGGRDRVKSKTPAGATRVKTWEQAREI